MMIPIQTSRRIIKIAVVVLWALLILFVEVESAHGQIPPTAITADQQYWYAALSYPNATYFYVVAWKKTPFLGACININTPGVFCQFNSHQKTEESVILLFNTDFKDIKNASFFRVSDLSPIVGNPDPNKQ